MSHTYRAHGGTLFHHDGGFTGGDVAITVYVKPEELSVAPSERGPAWRIEVPFSDLRELVFAYLRMRKIEQLEQAGDDEIEASLLSLPLFAASPDSTPDGA